MNINIHNTSGIAENPNIYNGHLIFIKRKSPVKDTTPITRNMTPVILSNIDGVSSIPVNTDRPNVINVNPKTSPKIPNMKGNCTVLYSRVYNMAVRTETANNPVPSATDMLLIIPPFFAYIPYTAIAKANHRTGLMNISMIAPAMA
jgi:hypothetical protein